MRKPQSTTAVKSPSPARLIAEKKKKRKEMKGGGEPFELCELCNLNHDQGRRHKYFPAHRRALANSLSRFHKKLSEIRFFIQNPSLLLPEHAEHNRIWCIFCAVDINETGGYFVCGNAIRHLAGEEHLRNLKRFFWKHGKGEDQGDLFIVTEEDLLKWEKNCKAMKNGSSSSSEGPVGPVMGPSKDIQFQHELNSIKMDTYSSSSFSSNISHPVLPLQRFTNENCPTYLPNGNGSATAAYVAHSFTSFSMGMHGNGSLNQMGGLESEASHLKGAQLNRLDFNAKGEPVATLMYDHQTDCKKINIVLQMVTQITLPSEESQRNVHTGGMPPWLDMCDESEKKLVNFGVQMNKNASPVEKRKSKKLNPKRVGAAWAEKRRIELEMEKKGEISDIVDANWLPNFGRVWQAGTRKESRKEFELENHQLFQDSMHSEASFKLQPYISKQMRIGSSSKISTVDQ